MLDWRPNYSGGGGHGGGSHMSQHHPMPPPPPPPPSSSRPQLPGIGLDEQLLGHDSVHTKNVNGIGWNVTGEKLASGSDDKTARIYDVSGTGQVKSLLKLDGHTDGVLALCWDPASPHRVVTSAGEKDKMVRVWDIRTGKPAMVQKMGQEYLNLAWSPDGSYIGVGSATLGSNDDATKDSMSIIDLRKGKARLHRFPYQLEEFCFSPNSKMILMTTEKGTIEIYRFEAETISSASPASEKSVPSSSSSSTTISAASSDERGWRGVLRSIKAHSGNIYSLAMHYNAGGGGHGGGSGMLAVGSKDSLVSLWDLEHLVCQRTVAQHETSIRSLSFSPDGERIASASYDHTVDISSVSTGARSRGVDMGGSISKVSWHPTMGSNLLAVARDAKADEKISYGYQHSNRSDYVRLLTIPPDDILTSPPPGMGSSARGENSGATSSSSSRSRMAD